MSDKAIHQTCCVCGNYAGHFEQWHNRDRGYGCCRPCALELDMSVDLIGNEGTHWANAEQWAAMQSGNTSNETKH